MGIKNVMNRFILIVPENIPDFRHTICNLIAFSAKFRHTILPPSGVI